MLTARLNRLRKKSRARPAVTPQRLKPTLKQGVYRSGKPLRHPKSSATSSFFAASEAVPFQNGFQTEPLRSSSTLW